MKLLIGTRERDHRQLLEMLFKRDGWDVTACAGLADVADLTMVDPPDAILIDPWQDGELSYLRQVMNVFWEFQVPVAFITTRVMADELEEMALFKPDLLIKIPGDMTRALPRRIQELAATEAAAKASKPKPDRAPSY